MNSYGYYQNGPSPDMTMALRAESAARRSFSTVALAAAVYCFASSIVANGLYLILYLVGFFNIPFIAENEASVSLLISCVSMYILVLPLFYLIVRRVPTFPIERSRMSILELLAIFLVSRFCLLAGSMVSNWITSGLSLLLGRDLVNSTEEMILDTPVWLLTLVVVIIGPIVEELIFRKWMIDRLGAYGDVSAILFTSVLFGLAHGNFFQCAYSFLLGLVLGYMYTRTGNILYPMALHMLTNLLGSVAMLPLMDIQEDVLAQLEAVGDDIMQLLEGPNAGQFMVNFGIMAIYSFLTYVLAITGAIIFFVYMRRLKLKPRLLEIVGSSAMTRSAIINLGVLLFFLLSVGEFALSLLPV